jgi:small subunit ribosomal protein S21
MEGGDQFMPGIRVKEGESFESALRRFKKKCEKAGVLSDLRKHQHFEKPSERRKRKENASRRKAVSRTRPR